MPTVTVLYFAVLREQRGTEREEIAIPEGTTAGALYARLFPAGPDGRLPVGFAVNREHTSAGAVLADGDEVAFLPPLGGG